MEDLLSPPVLQGSSFLSNEINTKRGQVSHIFSTRVKSMAISFEMKKTLKGIKFDGFLKGIKCHGFCLETLSTNNCPTYYGIKI